MNNVQIAAEKMAAVEPALATKFGLVIEFLNDNPGLVQKSAKIKDAAYLAKVAKTFAKSRGITPPSMPQTVSDPIIGVILAAHYGVEDIPSAVLAHSQAMSAENKIGNWLEAYIASVIEPHGWVWCSGSLVKAVDFIFKKPDGTWHALQIKNRDNSENSSSAAIRNDTEIDKWHRTVSKTGETLWADFPLADCGLSEEGFESFVRAALTP